jgi:hypothetical protein
MGDLLRTRVAALKYTEDISKAKDAKPGSTLRRLWECWIVKLG